MSLSQLDKSLAASTSNAVSALIDAHGCNICHELLSAPVSLPCSHVFCSECVRRHLAHKSVCPHPTCRKPSTYTQLTPLREYDVSLESLRRAAQTFEPARINEQNRLVFLSRKAVARTQLLDRLRVHNIPTNGGLEVLANRYNEFVIRWNANLDAGVPKSKKSIITAVMVAERAAEKQKKRSRASSFFAKATAAIDESDGDAPVEGDDFTKLIKKTKVRMARKRNLDAAADSSQKRACQDVRSDSQSSGGMRINEAGEGEANANGCPRAREADNDASLSRPSASQTEQQLGPEALPTVEILSASGNEALKSLEQPESQVRTECHGVCTVSLLNGNTRRKPRDPLSAPTMAKRRAHGNYTVGTSHQAMAYSQTTPEKGLGLMHSLKEERTVGVCESVDAVITVKNEVPPAGVFIPASAMVHAQRSIPSTADALPGSNQPLSSFGRQASPKRQRESLRKLNEYENHMAVSYMRRQCEATNSSHNPLVLGAPPRSDCEPHPLCGSQTPTPEQVARAERNRLAAIARRRKFYADQARSQMRQPDL